MNIDTTPKTMLVKRTGQWWRRGLGLALLALLWLAPGGARASDQVDVPGTTGSGQFGKSVTVLPNGNVVVTDPSYDIPGGATDVGAVYLYDGVTHAQISMLTGSTASDQVGSQDVVVLSNGNYVVRSLFWNDSRGAVTWGSATSGVAGTVSAANSLVGSTTDDYVGEVVTALSNGAYVVISSYWDGLAANVGAATWGDGATGVKGPVSAANSLVGSKLNDQVGAISAEPTDGVYELSNGNYVVICFWCDNGTIINAGAVTWGSGTSGVTGTVSAANSLMGSANQDQVGNRGIIALSNGNYVVRSPGWDNGLEVNAGAVTWGNGATGTIGTVSATNSLVGSTANDQVGYLGVTALSNGNYVVQSWDWDNSGVIDAGAATWGDGSKSLFGN